MSMPNLTSEGSVAWLAPPVPRRSDGPRVAPTLEPHPAVLGHASRQPARRNDVRHTATRKPVPKEGFFGSVVLKPVRKRGYWLVFVTRATSPTALRQI
jgi:hypothetical protein